MELVSADSDRASSIESYPLQENDWLATRDSGSSLSLHGVQRRPLYMFECELHGYQGNSSATADGEVSVNVCRWLDADNRFATSN
jgi:hypothetical protein